MYIVFFLNYKPTNFKLLEINTDKASKRPRKNKEFPLFPIHNAMTVKLVHKLERKNESSFETH